jgi:DnaK suppressor protein
MKIPNIIVENIKKNLEIELKKTKSTLISLKSQDPFSDPDRLIDNAASDTEAKEESNHDRVEALEKELNTYLVEIQQAMDRVEEGVYGQCQSCNKFIDTDRLAIKPTARFCLPCEKRKEK